MKLIPQTILAFLLLLLSSTSQAAEWDPLFSWTGKYPADKLVTGRGALLEQPAIKAALLKILPAHERAALRRFDVESRVSRVGGYLIVDKCKPHACPADLATIVIDVENQKIWAGFFTRASKSISTRWYGSHDDYSILPNEIKNAFLARQGE